MSRRDALAAHARTLARRARRLQWPHTALFDRAQQWIAARERLIAQWVGRTRALAQARMAPHTAAGARGRPVGTGAIRVLQWWEYESPLKRTLALEATLRHLFSIVPPRAPEAAAR